MLTQLARPVPARLLTPGTILAAAAGLVMLAAPPTLGANDPITAPTTLPDFFGPGTQPQTLIDPIASAGDCKSCHGGFDLLTEPLRPWAASPMGQAQRDPIFLACLAIANQDAAFAGDLCLRCHTPPGWLAGRSEPTDGSALIAQDYEGINCNFCHRMVDPVYALGVSPVEDEAILAALNTGDNTVPPSPHSGHYVVDPLDRRRGPFDLGSFRKHDWFQSPYHASSEMCAVCHDVSNPAFSRQPDNSYSLNDLGTISPSHGTHEQFPIERTYSEWSVSAFASGPIEMGGRFGGNLTAVSSCQDCHMPDATGQGCKTGEIRTNLPPHQFNGGNTWLLQAVRNLYPDSETHLEDQSVAESVARTVAMLRAAADLDAWQDGNDLVVRVTNWSGHKLPSGYPEGRRLWLNVEFTDELGQTVAEHGHYDDVTAELTGDTRVWETKLGISEDLAAVLGKPAGEGFHFAVNNVRVFDNRIPPLGFTNAAFEAIQSEPVGHVYADGQHWDDVTFAIPAGATGVEVELYYQSVSLEYATFLHTENHTNNAGVVFWNQYLATGMSPPVEMGSVAIPVSVSYCQADMNGDGFLDNGDILSFINAFLGGNLAADFNGDALLDNGDIAAFVSAFLAGC